MFIQITDKTLLFEADGNTFADHKMKLWFKGYFFLNDVYYHGQDAGNFLLETWLSSKIAEIINYCNGIFTCVMVNTETSETVVLKDRYGFGQLFYVLDNDKCYISDDFWEIQKRCNRNRLNLEGVYEMLLTRYVISDGTMIEDIKEFLPASIYKITTSRGLVNFKREEYWHFNYKPEKINQEEGEIKLVEILDRIIKRYQENVFKNSKIGINLTGGLDSRFLLGLLLKNSISPDNIKAYTFGKAESDDIRYSAMVASSAGIQHRSAIFNKNFEDFFNAGTIDEILKQIGFSTYYFQGYGISKLMKEYENISYLLTGSDGFYVGLKAGKELFSLQNKEDLIHYIYKKNATILNQEECDFILKEHRNLEQIIKNKIAGTLPENNFGLISAFYDWTFKNRMRKYMLSIYELLNKKTFALFPFYDYEFLDFMASLPYELLAGQRIYFNAMFRHTFSGNLKYLRNIPAEFREKIVQRGPDFSVKFKEYGILYRLIKKVFALPEKFYLYPIFSFFKQSPGEFLRLTDSLISNHSKIIENKNIIGLLRKNRHKEYFFRYGLLVIISILRFEQLINNRFEDRQENHI